nr:MATE family efflux transporter [Candidatus Kapabacteria bacterium]
GAVAIVGFTESLLTIIYAISFGIATAATAVVARRIGENNAKEASIAAFQAILTGLFLSIIISLFGIIYYNNLLVLMGANSYLISEYSGYTFFMLSGNITIMLLFIINAIIRSSGDAALSMKVLWLANIINIVLDPCLIFGWGPFPELGITGAAIATNIGRGIAVLFQIYLLFSGKHRVKLYLSSLKIDFKVIFQIIKLSLGSIGQNIIATSSWIGLMRIAATFGSEVVAGYTIGIRIILFTLMPMAGLANAASTLVGQNLGAKNPIRAEKSAMLAAKYNFIFFSIVVILFVALPDFWVKLLTTDAVIVENATNCLRIVSYGMIMYGIGMVMMNSINGAGDTLTPTYITLFAFWLLEIPLAYLLAITFDFKESGIYYAIVFSESILTIIAFIVFKKGKWKLKVV